MENCKVLSDGSVVGTLIYVSNFEEFDTNPDNQNGNYFMIELGDKYKGKDITVQRNGGVAKTEKDTQWLIRVPSTDTTYEFKDGEDVIITLNFKNAKLENE